MPKALYKIKGPLKKRGKEVNLLAIKIYEGQTFHLSPRPASRDVKAEAYKQWYSSRVGSPCLDLCCGCAWRRLFVSLVDEARSEAEVLNFIFISYTNANHATNMLLHSACKKVLPDQINHILSCCKAVDGDLQAQSYSFLYIRCPWCFLHHNWEFYIGILQEY